MYGLRLLARREGARAVECGCQLLCLSALRDEDEESALREEWRRRCGALVWVGERAGRRQARQQTKQQAR